MLHLKILLHPFRELFRVDVSRRPGGKPSRWISRSIASSANSPVAAIADSSQRIFGLQFHPEVRHTPHGQEIVSNFVLTICKAKPDWTAENIIHQAISDIRTQVGDERVISATSGGVDSTVATALVHRAVGDQPGRGLCGYRSHAPGRTCCRWSPSFREKMGIRLHPVDASSEFISALSGITEPERKRKIIGSLFIHLFEQQAAKLGNPPYLVQGTIYPDVVESSATTQGKAERIKSHHNVGGLPEQMRFKLVEPLRNLFKDEVRKIGEALGVARDLVWRQPFPGPGLAVRCLGEVTAERVERLRQADAIFSSPNSPLPD